MDILNCIKKTTLQSGYSQEVADCLAGMMRYMIDKQLVGACHATASALYVALSELGLHPQLCIGEVLTEQMAFDHSWLLVDGKMVDLACYMTLAGMGLPVSYPILFGKNAVTGTPPELDYGAQSGQGLDETTERILRMPFQLYMDCFPYEENGLWDVVARILPHDIIAAELRSKYRDVKRHYSVR